MLPSSTVNIIPFYTIPINQSECNGSESGAPSECHGVSETYVCVCTCTSVDFYLVSGLGEVTRIPRKVAKFPKVTFCSETM